MFGKGYFCFLGKPWLSASAFQSPLDAFSPPVGPCLLRGVRFATFDWDRPILSSCIMRQMTQNFVVLPPLYGQDCFCAGAPLLPLEGLFCDFPFLFSQQAAQRGQGRQAAVFALTHPPPPGLPCSFPAASLQPIHSSLTTGHSYWLQMRAH